MLLKSLAYLLNRWFQIRTIILLSRKRPILVFEKDSNIISSYFYILIKFFLESFENFKGLENNLMKLFCFLSDELLELLIEISLEIRTIHIEKNKALLQYKALL